MISSKILSNNILWQSQEQKTCKEWNLLPVHILGHSDNVLFIIEVVSEYMSCETSSTNISLVLSKNTEGVNLLI